MCMWNCLLLSALLFSLPASTQDVVLIVNPENTIDALSRRDLKKIYFNQISHWRDGVRVVPVTLASGNIHNAFLMRYLRKNEHQFSLFWKRLLFSGNGVPPVSFASEEEVIDFVARTPGAIGYVSKNAPLEGVVALPLEDDSP